MQAKDPSKSMVKFVHSKYELFLTYLNANPMDRKDLKRASTLNSKVCVLLTDKFSKNPYSCDYQNILIGLSIKKYVKQLTGENKRLCIQLIKPESKT